MHINCKRYTGHYNKRFTYLHTNSLIFLLYCVNYFYFIFRLLKMSNPEVSYTMNETNTHSFFVCVVITVVVAILIIKIITRRTRNVHFEIENQNKGKGKLFLIVFFFLILHCLLRITLHVPISEPIIEALCTKSYIYQSSVYRFCHTPQNSVNYMCRSLNKARGIKYFVIHYVNTSKSI